MTDRRAPTDYREAVQYGVDALEGAGSQANALVVPVFPAPQPTATRRVRICLIDPKKLLAAQGGLRKKFRHRVVRHLNGLQAKTFGPNHLKTTLGLRFMTTYAPRDTTRAQRAAFGKFDYPIYLLNAHKTPDTPASEVVQIVKDHKIRDVHDFHEKAEKGWKNPNVEGMGFPPLRGYRKVGFVKVDKAFDGPGAFDVRFANLILHELGHMFGITKHTKGLMMRAIVLADQALDYEEGHKQTILSELGRLKVNSEAAMEKAYLKL